jgi:hypothetical protein
MDTAARRLSPLDSTFLELEQADEDATMHIGAALISHRAATPDLPVLEAALREEFPRWRELAAVDPHPPEAPCQAP